MRKHTINDLQKQERRAVELGGLSLRQWVIINFSGWGFYSIAKIGNGYDIMDKYTGEILYQVK